MIELEYSARERGPAKNNIVWLIAYSSLFATVILIGFKQYQQAIYFSLLLVIVISLINRACAVVTVIAFFPCDQILSGVFQEAISPGRYMVLVNIAIGVIAVHHSILKLRPQVTAQYIIYMFVLVLGLLSLTWVEDIHRGSIYLGKLATLILWSFIAVPELSNQAVLTRLAKILAIVTAGASIIFIVGDIGRINVNDRIMLEGLGINSIASFFGFSIIFTLYYFFQNERLLMKLVVGACIAISFTAILKMGTRSVVAGIPLALFAAGILSGRKSTLKYSLYGFLAAMSLLLLLLLAVEYNVITSNLANRYIGLNSVETYAGNSRVELAKLSIRYALLDNPIGTGAGHEHLVFENLSHRLDAYESHNTLISTLVQFGILGFVFLVVSLMVSIYSAYRNVEPKYRYAIIAILLYFCFQLIKQSTLQTRVYWFPFTIILALINCHFCLKSSAIVNLKAKQI